MKKKIFAIMADGYEELELIAVVDVLKRLDIGVDLVALGENLEVTGSHEISIKANFLLSEIEPLSYDGIFLAGGLPGSTNLYNDKNFISLLKNMHNSAKLITAICAAPICLSKAGILEGKNFTMYPNFDKYLNGEKYSNNYVEVAQNIITGKGPGAVFDLAKAIAEFMGLGDEVKVLYEQMFVKG